MNYYQVTTVLSINGGLHFKYNFALANTPQDAMTLIACQYEGYVIDNQTAERCGIPLEGVKVIKQV